MKANELRIGNYVYLYGNVAKLHPTDFNKWCNDFEFKDFKPIPLTEDILLKCGFENINFKYQLNNFIIWLDPRSLNYQLYSEGPTSNIKHLHKLQNIYFALTNEELNINL